jgi:predicted RNA-binding Zn ribbon-like protein
VSKLETPVEPPTAATMRLDGGHPGLDLVNTVYAQVNGPVEHDVLASPGDLATFARRVGLAGGTTGTSPDALRAARALRDALDTVLRARLADEPAPGRARAAVEDAVRAALAAGRLAPHGAAFTWSWPARDAFTPVHRLAVAAVELLTDEPALARLHCCAGCCWLFLDHSRGPGRRWCSMADCGTNAKKRRYVERRRQRRSDRTGADTWSP